MKIKPVFFSLSSAFLSSLYAASTFAQTSAPQQVPAGAAAPQGGPIWINFVLIGGVVLFMWLFIIRPQSKRAKEQKEFLSSLTPGLEVFTSGGIIGTIVEVKDNIIALNIGNSTVRVLRTSISGKLNDPLSISK